MSTTHFLSAELLRSYLQAYMTMKKSGWPFHQKSRPAVLSSLSPTLTIGGAWVSPEVKKHQAAIANKNRYHRRPFRRFGPAL